MTIELLDEYKGKMVQQHQTVIFSSYWGKRTGRLKDKMQEKNAFEDTGTSDAPPYILLSSTGEKQVPMDNLSHMRTLTAAHATELKVRTWKHKQNWDTFIL